MRTLLREGEIIKRWEDTDAPLLQYITSSRITFKKTHKAVTNPKGRQL
jgi:hypothetical protein